MDKLTRYMPIEEDGMSGIRKCKSGSMVLYTDAVLGLKTMGKRIAELERENERLRAENLAMRCCGNCGNNDYNNECDYNDCSDYPGDPYKVNHWKPRTPDKYAEIRKLSEKDCDEIFEFAMKRSKEILEGSDE